MTRYRNKLYWRIPGGEVQYGLLSRRITVWWRRKRRLVWLCLRAGDVMEAVQTGCGRGQGLRRRLWGC